MKSPIIILGTEDDILVKNHGVFDVYIKHAKVSGIYHLNYALHGPANKVGGDEAGSPNPREIVEYDNDVEIALYPNCVGAFSYYHKDVIQTVGYMDEFYKNAWEHVDHTAAIAKAGFHPPFWWFADINKSWEYLDDIKGSIQNSSIRHTDEWNQRMSEGAMWFKRKFGHIPTQMPNVSIEEVQNIVSRIEEKFGKK